MNDCAMKEIRRFNRYYTAWLDVMNEGSYMDTDLSWPEARILFEIYICPDITATGLCEHLRMDKGYVSRVLSKFEKNGLLTRQTVSGAKGQKR